MKHPPVTEAFLSGVNSDRQHNPGQHGGVAGRQLGATKVCVLAGTLGQGGAERQLFHLLESLIRHGAAPTLLSLSRDEHWQRPIEALGVGVRFVGMRPSRLVRAFSILKATRASGAEFIQSQHFYTNIYSSLAGRLLGVRSIAAVRSNVISELQGNARLLRRLGLQMSDRVAANSRMALKTLAGMGFSGDRLFFLPNVIDLARFPARATQAWDGSSIRVLGIGRLGPEKRFDRFIEILRLLQREVRVPVRAVIAGEGTERAKLENLATAARREGVEVSLPGSTEDVLSLYHSADVLLSSSDWEGTPNVIMEAMATGTPVVGSRVGGVAELVREGQTGFLFEPDDLRSAVVALRKSVGDCGGDGRNGWRARAMIQDERSLEVLAPILGRLYDFSGNGGLGSP